MAFDWWLLTGGFLLAASYWWLLTGDFPLAASYWWLPTGSFSLRFHPVGETGELPETPLAHCVSGSVSDRDPKDTLQKHS